MTRCLWRMELPPASRVGRRPISQDPLTAETRDLAIAQHSPILLSEAASAAVLYRGADDADANAGARADQRWFQGRSCFASLACDIITLQHLCSLVKGGQLPSTSMRCIAFTSEPKANAYGTIEEDVRLHSEKIYQQSLCRRWFTHSIHNPCSNNILYLPKLPQKSF
jgi:hypothetical protein